VSRISFWVDIKYPPALLIICRVKGSSQSGVSDIILGSTLWLRTRRANTTLQEVRTWLVLNDRADLHIGRVLLWLTGQCSSRRLYEGGGASWSRSLVTEVGHLRGVKRRCLPA
jgi:hypothetical protein